MAVTSYFSGSGGANYELRLYEGQTRFDVIYGTVDQGDTSATGGVQQNDSAFDQYFCNGSGGATTGGQSYILQACCPSPTPTASPSATATATPTATATVTTSHPRRYDTAYAYGPADSAHTEASSDSAAPAVVLAI